MDEDSLILFIDVAHRLSFVAVADARGTDPSTISRSISSLENKLGARLFHRSTRRMALTEAGEKFLARAMLIREMIEEAREDAAEQGRQPSGLLRMTAATGIGEYVIAPNLARFRERFPKVGVELILTSRKVDLIAERIDLAVRLSRPVVRDHIVSKLSSIRYCIGASPDYLARHPDLGLGDSADPRCLANHDCLLFVPLDLGPLWRFRSQTGETVDVTVRSKIAVSTPTGLRSAAIAGAGPVLLPHWVLKSAFEDGSLLRLFPGHEVAPPDFDSATWLLYPSRDYVPAKVRAMIDFLRDDVLKNI